MSRATIIARFSRHTIFSRITRPSRFTIFSWLTRKAFGIFTRLSRWSSRSWLSTSSGFPRVPRLSIWSRYYGTLGAVIFVSIDTIFTRYSWMPRVSWFTRITRMPRFSRFTWVARLSGFTTFTLSNQVYILIIMLLHALTLGPVYPGCPGAPYMI